MKLLNNNLYKRIIEYLDKDKINENLIDILSEFLGEWYYDIVGFVDIISSWDIIRDNRWNAYYFIINHRRYNEKKIYNYCMYNCFYINT